VKRNGDHERTPNVMRGESNGTPCRDRTCDHQLKSPPGAPACPACLPVGKVGRDLPTELF